MCTIFKVGFVFSGTCTVWWLQGFFAHLWIEPFQFEPCPGTMCCVHCLSSPRCLNGYQQIQCWRKPWDGLAPSRRPEGVEINLVALCYWNQRNVPAWWATGLVCRLTLQQSRTTQIIAWLPSVTQYLTLPSQQMISYKSLFFTDLWIALQGLVVRITHFTLQNR